jgi:glycopeptide antibiotics resistance protein
MPPLVYRLAVLGFVCRALVGCQSSAAPAQAKFVRSVPWAEHGVWLKADTHVHTRFSDGGVELGAVASRAAANGCQVLAITDRADAELAATSDEYFAALKQARKANPDLILLAGLEWNVPPWQGREHATLLLPPDLPERQILRDFQVLFDDWKRPGRDPDLATKALAWLESKASGDAAAPVVIYNHPCRQRDDASTLVEEMSQWLKSSAVPIGFEGGPGHQDSDPIGDYAQSLKTIDRWDPAVAEVGGAWDQLLSRGLPVWAAVATSDFHNGDPEAPDDFWPGEFSETWLYAPAPTADGALAALRAGTFFGVHGQIARQVQLRVFAAGLPREAIAGEAIQAAPGDELVVTLHMDVPLVDWRGEPNRIDEVELIGITARESKVIARQSPTSASALRLSLLVPDGGIALRARGRRSVIDGPDLMFYTNPIQVMTSGSTNGLQTSGLDLVLAAHAPGAVVADASGANRPSRPIPAWISLAFVLAGSVLTSLIDRWQIEVRRRFSRDAVAPTPRNYSLPRAWRRYFLALLLGFIFLAVYGSLVPLQPSAMDWPTAAARFQSILQQPVSVASRTDWATNVLLFVPIGFLATGLVFGASPGDLRRGLGIVVVVAACAALSLAIEFGQLWVADRTCSQNDIVAESLGSLIGASAWLFLGPLLITWMSRVLEASRPRQQIERMLEAYTAIVFAYMLMPLDLTLGPAEIYDKFQEGKLNLIPFQDIAASPVGIVELLGDMLLLVPLGMLAALWHWPVWERVRPFGQSLVAGALAVLAIEAAQLFVYSRYSSTTDLITGVLGVIVGWLIADWLVRGNATQAERGHTSQHSLSFLLAMTAVYAVIVAAVLCLPFNRWASPAEAAERLSGLFSRPPLTAFYWGTELNAVSEMLRKTLLSVPLGGLLAFSLRAWRPAAARTPLLIAAACLAAALWALGIELLQVWLPPHVADSTDALLCTLGTVVGLLALGRVLYR